MIHLCIRVPKTNGKRSLVFHQQVRCRFSQMLCHIGFLVERHLPVNQAYIFEMARSKNVVGSCWTCFLRDFLFLISVSQFCQLSGCSLEQNITFQLEMLVTTGTFPRRILWMRVQRQIQRRPNHNQKQA